MGSLVNLILNLRICQMHIQSKYLQFRREVEVPITLSLVITRVALMDRHKAAGSLNQLDK